MAEKQEHPSARDLHSCSSKLVCPLSLISLLICTAALVRVEIINQRVHDVEDLVVDARQNHNVVKFSTNTASFKRAEKVESAREFDHKITEEREDEREVDTGRTRRFSPEAGTKQDQLTMESVRSEINKTFYSLTSRSFCSPKQQICVQGPPGMQGPKGSRGRRGPRGTIGRKGSRGDRGEPGPHGKQGILGRPGPKGEEGIMGAQGQKGEKGIMGSPGQKGSQGVLGQPGRKGNQGIIGASGPKGNQGYMGPTGPKGNHGFIGPAGQKGKQGYMGSPGAKGNQGFIGPAGQKGKQGYMGSPGAKGNQGFIGPPGQKGKQGYMGPPGAKGNQGIMGPPGRNGQHGIKGPPGLKGIMGPKGGQGSIGVPGPRGITGAKGEPGDLSQPPTMVISPMKHTITLKQSAVFQCSVGGNPKPSVRWLGKSGTPLRSLDGRLDVRHVTIDDAGEYTCIGRNALGITSQTAILTIIEAVECTNYSSLTSGDRKTTYIFQSGQCDSSLKGWYRFQGAAGTRMPTSCPPKESCDTLAAGWLNGGHPTVADGKVTRQVCFSYTGCCWQTTNIQVRNCGSYYVYYFNGTPNCSYRYCGTD